MRRLILPSTLLCLLGSQANAMQLAPGATIPARTAVPISLHDVAPQAPNGTRDFWSADPLRHGAAVIESSIDAMAATREESTLYGVVPSESPAVPSSGASALVSFTLAALLLSITLYVLLVVSQRRRYVFYLAPILATSTASLLLLVAIFGNPLTGIGIFGAPPPDAGAAMAGSKLSRALMADATRSMAPTGNMDLDHPRGATLQTVPEPSSASLLACGLGWIVRSRRQRRR